MLMREKLQRLLELYNKKAVAKAADIDLSTLLSWISGTHEPRIKALERLSAVIGVNVGWLVDNSKSWPPVREHSEVSNTA